VTRYIPAFSWGKDIEDFVKEIILERPILNVCSGDSPLGDVRLDKHKVEGFFPSDVLADMSSLPFTDDSFGAVFCDPPWGVHMKKKCGDFCKEALRVAPVLYLMSPWVWGTARAVMTKVWVRQHPGFNNAILISRYERMSQNTQESDKHG